MKEIREKYTTTCDIKLPAPIDSRAPMIAGKYFPVSFFLSRKLQSLLPFPLASADARPSFFYFSFCHNQ